MSASLVGSEMCIRDSFKALAITMPPARNRAGIEQRLAISKQRRRLSAWAVFRSCQLRGRGLVEPGQQQ
eukprot:11748638-Alexandrium_andersonii.AAC.1